MTIIKRNVIVYKTRSSSIEDKGEDAEKTRASF